MIPRHYTQKDFDAFDIDNHHEIDIKKLISHLQNALDQGYDLMEIDYDCYDGVRFNSFIPFKMVLESDESYNRRVEAVNEWNKSQELIREKQEMAEYLRLKAKYESE